MLHPEKGYHERGQAEKEQGVPPVERAAVNYRMPKSKPGEDMERMQLYRYFLFAYNFLIFVSILLIHFSPKNE
jgi:hypothetical protein